MRECRHGHRVSGTRRRSRPRSRSRRSRSRSRSSRSRSRSRSRRSRSRSRFRRSWSRSRSPLPRKTSRLPQDRDDEWGYSRGDYRSPSQALTDRRASYKQVCSPSRTTSVRREHRYGYYCKDVDSAGSDRSPSSSPRRERRERLQSSGSPVRYGPESSSYRARDYDCDREVHKEGEGYFRKKAQKEPKGLGPRQNVKQRLGPVANAEKPQKLARKVSRKLPSVLIRKRRIMDNVDGSDSPQPSESSEVKKRKRAELRTEPPEDSKEFEQLVQSAFLKFVKLLNANLAERRRYLEQGESGPFKCTVCGSPSEFADTLSLAQHAFQSCKIGCRSKHLGFHKALCVLMGWKCAEAPNSSWAFQILSASEALSVKDDLIIWPPVVFMHNSSIGKGNPNDRIVVSIEQLKDVLKGMGFGQYMTNLCHGKSANQSVMVASFIGTFSGLGEAERLHRHYTENQHGRLELQQITSGSSSSSEEAQKQSTDGVESVLYGYLGNVGDLGKLDFQTKNRCQVRSKKEIEAIADEPLAF